MKNLLLAIVASVFVTAAPAQSAKLGYAEARTWLGDFSTARGANQLMALDPVKVRQHTQKWQAINQRAEKLFGDPLGKFGACVKAAGSAENAWQDIVTVTLARESERAVRAAGSAAFMSFSAGEQYAECYDLIESLDTPRKK